MAAKPDLNAIAIELDQVHAVAQRAFRARDIDTYRSLFTDDLRYVQPNGKTIGRVQLMRDVAKQLSQFKTADSKFTRESLTMNDDGTVTEICSQNVVYSVTVFFMFTKTWRLGRRGKYTYRKTDTGWQICNVEVLSETVN